MHVALSPSTRGRHCLTNQPAGLTQLSCGCPAHVFLVDVVCGRLRPLCSPTQNTHITKHFKTNKLNKSVTERVSLSADIIFLPALETAQFMCSGDVSFPPPHKNQGALCEGKFSTVDTTLCSPHSVNKAFGPSVCPTQNTQSYDSNEYVLERRPLSAEKTSHCRERKSLRTPACRL